MLVLESSGLTKEQLRELGLIGDKDGTDTLGGEKPSEDQADPTPASSPSPPSSGTAELLQTEMRQASEASGNMGLPHAHFARLDRTKDGTAYVVTVTDFTGTIGMQLFWPRSMLHNFIKLALRMDPALIVDGESEGTNPGVHQRD